jgi:hypothetical protein
MWFSELKVCKITLAYKPQMRVLDTSGRLAIILPTEFVESNFTKGTNVFVANTKTFVFLLILLDLRALNATFYCLLLHTTFFSSQDTSPVNHQTFSLPYSPGNNGAMFSFILIKTPLDRIKAP